MKCKCFCPCPVRPLICPLAAPVNGEDEGWESLGSSHIEADRQDVQREKPDDLIDVDDEMVCQPCEPMIEPKVPTAAQIAAHNISHLPYRSWCPHCVAARRPNSHHARSSSEDRKSSPLLVADYCFMKDNQDEDITTVLVVRLYPAKAILATVCPSKGVDEHVISRVTSFVRDSGYLKLIYRSDQEPALRALLEQAFKKASEAQLEQAVPECSAVGESQSNGRAESTVLRIQDLVRTYKCALESRIDARVPCDSPIFFWLVEHAASVYNRYVCTEDGSTPYQNLHGQRFRGRAVEFGEQVFYYVPKRLRSKMSLRWRLGTFVGNHQNSNEALVASSNGDVIKARSIVRVIEPSRWSKTAILGVKGTPFKLRPKSNTESDAEVEELMEPHLNADQHHPEDSVKDTFDQPEVRKLDRQLRITQKDLDQFGYSDDCPKCSDLRAGKMISSKPHNDQCRVRIYLHYKETNHPKWRAVRHLFEDHDSSPSFHANQVDKEGAPLTPPPLLEVEPLPQDPADARDEEANQMDEAVHIALDSEPMADDAVADLFMDFEDDAEHMDTQEANENAMLDALIQAGVQPALAKETAHQMMALKNRSTFVEAYGKSITDYANAHRRNLNIDGLASLDLRSPKPSGEPWDFRKASDRREARRLVKKLDPDWLIGAPPCTAFSIWNYGLNYKKMDAEAVREKLEEGRIHLAFVASLYEDQIRRGKYFLHEQPATAMSWKEEPIEKIMNSRAKTYVVTADQCAYGLTTPSAEDPEKLLPALKPTRFLTNSEIMAEQLSRRCSKDHIHQPLVGGRCKDAAMYPSKLVRSILKGVTLQAEADAQSADCRDQINAMPVYTPQAEKVDFGPPTHSSVPKFGKKGSVPITYEESNFKSRYMDEYTGETLAPHLIRPAIEDELNYFNSKVWQLSTIDEMKRVPDYILVRSRWVLCNKGDSANPDVRARLVGCELNQGNRNDAFSASTPPLEGKRILFSRYVSERHRFGRPLRISFIDVRKAYFNAIPERAIYMRLPKEMGLPPDTVARQVRCVYGTRDAGKLWEDTYTLVMESLGFKAGESNPCVFWNEERQLMCVVHGDDFTTLGLDEDLDFFEKGLQESFEIKIRGRLGEGCKDQEIRILNRVVSITEEGLTYEADPRHCDLLLNSLGLDEGNISATPGIKPTDRDDFAVKSNEPGIDPLLDYNDPDKVIASICNGEFEGPVECEKHLQVEPQPNIDSFYRQVIDREDPWMSQGDCGLWIQKRNLARSELQPPPDADHLMPMRFTYGRFNNGKTFSLFDSWRHPSEHLAHPWTGITIFFDEQCTDVDGCIKKICDLHDVSMDSHQGILKYHTPFSNASRQDHRRVSFSDDEPNYLEVIPYSEVYGTHPHFILASAHGWKRNPSRSDPYTGKSSAVMTQRKKAARKSLRSRYARQNRQSIMNTANRHIINGSGEARSSRSHGPSPVQDHISFDSMDVEPSSDNNHSTDMDVDYESNADMVDVLRRIFLMTDMSRKVFATRTKPLKKQGQKRVGAKKAKKLEISEDSSYQLSPADATIYRALAARCNYLAQDRPDIAFSSKELCREFSVPTQSSFKKLKRLCRYLAGMPRLQYIYRWQDMPKEVAVFVDTDFAGCKETRRSTSGGTAMIGCCLIKHWSKTQSTISLSSGEAELHGIAQGCAQGLGVQSLLKDAGWILPLHVYSDATAAIGIARRKGLGKIRHLDVTDLWIQDRIRSKAIFLDKVLGTENMADVLTKYVDRRTMESAIARMGLRKASGRPACAPEAMGAM